MKSEVTSNGVSDDVREDANEDWFVGPREDVLDALSDDALLERVEELIRRERHITFNVVMHLGEVERRRIYVRQGYASMFDYCTRGLRYSESAACRRIKTYRCIRDFPEVAELVKSGQLTTVTVAIMAGVMNRENCAELLKAASGKSQCDVQKIVAGYKTGKPFRDRIKAVAVERPMMSLGSIPAPELGQIHLHDGGKNDPTSQSEDNPDGALARPGGPALADDTRVHGTSTNSGASHAASPPQPERETYYEFTIAADEEFMQMYQRVRAIQSVKATPGNDIASTFKALMGEYIARHAPEEKQVRRDKRTPRAGSKNKSQTTRSRHIPPSVRDKVLMRDQYQCTYAGTDGVRCNATRHLQFDHVVPFARGGDHAPDNLRLLCAAHNRLEAAGAFRNSVP